MPAFAARANPPLAPSARTRTCGNRSASSARDPSRGAVVDDEHLGGRGRLGRDGLEHAGQPALAVVVGDHDRDVHRPRRYPLRWRAVPFTVVVVLHDSAAELAALLRSIDAHVAVRPQLVVVDTGTPDGGAELAAASGAEVLERRENPGFGAASNAGLERARHDVTVLLNPDCELIDGSLSALAAIAGAYPRALHAPRLLNRDGSVQRSAHPLPGTVGALAGALLHPPLLPRALRDRLEPYRAERSRTVGWAIAACLAGRDGRAARARPVRSGRRTCSARTWTSACALARPGCRRCCIRRCGCATPAATRRCATASRSSCSPRGGARCSARRSGRRALALDDARRRSRSPRARPVTPCWGATRAGRRGSLRRWLAPGGVTCGEPGRAPGAPRGGERAARRRRAGAARLGGGDRATGACSPARRGGSPRPRPRPGCASPSCRSGRWRGAVAPGARRWT